MASGSTAEMDAKLIGMTFFSLSLYGAAGLSLLRMLPEAGKKRFSLDPLVCRYAGDLKAGVCTDAPMRR